MYYNKYIITEAIRLNTSEDIIKAIRNNSVGVRINPNFKKDVMEDYISEKFSAYLKKCKTFNVKDITYGVQLILQKSEPYKMENLIHTDGLYEFLNSYKKPWVKELEEYKVLMSSQTWTPQLLHSLEKAIQNEAENHGKKSKGNGDLKDVKSSYNDGTWKLLIPSSFEGEKAAAFYKDSSGKETPTRWCTRANKNYYDHYTKLGPLYIIRNMKNGKSYQIAFTKSGIDFLDQDDEDGDEITGGDLTAIPDDLLKLIKDYRGGKTLYDFKHKEKEAPKTKAPKGKILDTDAILQNPLSSKAKFSKEVNLGNNIYKKEILNFSEKADNANEFQKFFNFKNGKYEKIPEKLVKKNKATIYYLKDKPTAILAYYTSVWDDKARLDGVICQTAAFQKLSSEEKELLDKAAQEDFGFNKHEQRKAKADNFDNLKKRFLTAFKNKKDEIINTVNSSNLFTNTNYKKIVDFENPDYTKNNNLIEGAVIPKKISFMDNNGETKTIAFFARRFIIYKNGRDVDEANDKEIEIFKKARKEITRQIIKIPEYKAINIYRKVNDGNSSNVAFEEVNYFNY